MPITASLLNRWCRIPATLTTKSTGTTRDEMGALIPAETTESVLVCLHPEQGTEVTTGRQVSTGRHVVYLKPCTEPKATSTLTVGTAEYEFDEPPLEWTHPITCERIGWEGRLVRST